MKYKSFLYQNCNLIEFSFKLQYPLKVFQYVLQGIVGIQTGSSVVNDQQLADTAQWFKLTSDTFVAMRIE